MGDDNELVNQDEIEKLLQQSMSPGAAKPAASSPAAASTPPSEAVSQQEIESMLASGPKKASTPAATAAAGDASKLLAQDDIERLLNQAGKTAAATPAPKQAAAASKEKTAVASSNTLLPGEGEMAQGDVEYILNQAERALSSIDELSANEPPSGVVSFRLQEFSGAPPSTETATLDLIRDVELDLKIELGRTHMYLEDVLKLRRGSVVPLDKMAGDPVDILVNGRLIARGEVLVLNDNFCVRVAELIAGAKPGG
jgi:flagellar motor switch protein FliN/FliY